MSLDVGVRVWEGLEGAVQRRIKDESGLTCCRAGGQQRVLMTSVSGLPLLNDMGCEQEMPVPTQYFRLC